MTAPGFYLTALTSTRVPRDHGVITVIPRLEGGRSGYAQHWNGCAFTYGEPLGQNSSWSAPQHNSTPEFLWGDITGWAKGSRTFVLWCHDLPWTVRLTRALEQLPHFGWRLSASSFTPGASWTSWTKGRTTLRILDITAILPLSEQRLGTLFGEHVPMRPPWGATSAEWIVWAARQNLVTASIVGKYLYWVREEDLGSLAVTGAAQSFTAFRRRFLTEQIVIHGDRDLRAMERAAAHTGRCEAWYHGTIVSDPVDEWDFTNAYTNIVAEQAVPVAPLYPIHSGFELLQSLDREGIQVLAEVEVRTSEPVVPLRASDRIIWPTGRFVTTLWEPELRAALDANASLRLIRGHAYRSAHALATWGQWVRGELDQSDDVVPAWRKAILKRWGNVLVGRFGMRYPRWDPIGETTGFDVFHSTGWAEEGGEPFQLMRIGRDLFIATEQTDPTYSAPMITSWVMSAMRAKLWRVMRALPEGRILYVDTDSVLCLRASREMVGALSTLDVGKGLRLKRTWQQVTILGPRQIITNAGVKMAGIPRDATLLEGNVFEGEVTEGLLESIGRQRYSTVASRFRSWRVEGSDTRRAGSQQGWTTPFNVDLPYQPENP